MLGEWLKHLPIKGPWQVEPALSGVSNQVYVISNGQQRYVLKRFCHDHPYGLDRQQEVQLQQQLAQQGLAAEVIHYDAERGLLLQQFVPAPALAQTKMTEVERVRIVAENLAHIHRIQVNLASWSLRQRVDSYLQSLAQFDAATAANFRRRLRDYRELLDSWGAHPVFCHNDLAYQHILLTQPNNCVLDWEYAGYGERLFDIASTIVVNRLSAASSLSLVHAYEGISGQNIDWQRLQCWIALVKQVNQLWFELHHKLQQT
ncbi:phosphotransferase [Idiomarina xiamenensis]|uniref:LPS biosynthesis choline kinase n=1 Tax=Idiomarina xiamenensis 10-D-4 TaxID=740709 RepID=K2KCR9_9GAMM|nr:phosphotransferase [Idiomarina xiamenensis]EKE84487.1 LPS biosynthesis choline kinase [Idiomarina xiamenensis 10-D-4]